MQDLDDRGLLREYVESDSEEAFSRLVTRHVNKVYSVALRHTGNVHTAEEITQAVFVIMARKSRQLRSGVILSGWLYQTARLTSLAFIRGEIRRARREQEAYLQTASNENESEAWAQIAPLLDAAMAGLNETERSAIVLRFFDGKSMKEVAAVLGATEDATKMRVYRAVEKLRLFFTKRGVAVSSAVLTTTLRTNSVQAASVSLAKAATAVALAKGVTASASTLTLIKGALKVMAWTKAKTAIVATAAVLLAAGTTTVVVEKIASARSAPKIPKLSATDLSWADDQKYWAIDSRVLDKLPSGVFIFRPTRFPKSGGGVWSQNRMTMKNYSVPDLMDTAYGFAYTRTVFPSDMPREHFDVIGTIPDGSKELLKDELKQRFGLTAHKETREMDVLLLKVKDPNPPELKLHGRNDGVSSWRGGDREITIENNQLNGFFSNIETTIGQPVIDQTGLTDRYDAHMKWRAQPGETDKDAFKRALLEQLGLELVPSREPIEMLIVDKAS